MTAEGAGSATVQADDDAQERWEHAPCGLLSTLPDGMIVRVNATLLDWTGYDRDDVLGRNFTDLLSSGSRLYHETRSAPLLHLRGEVQEVAVDLVHANGEHLPALVNTVVRTDDAGRPLLHRTAVFVAEERRAYERELFRTREEARASEARAQQLAQTLQQTFVPPAPPDVPGLDVAAAYRPAGRGGEVGGDFYDVFETVRGDWAVVLGDVCGKGAPAAGMTALARHTVRAAAMGTAEPSGVLGTLNRALLDQEDGERFCTAVYGRMQPRPEGGCRLTVAAGGHALPLRVRTDGQVEAVGRTGSLVGLLPAVEFHDTIVELAPGEAMVLFTDGVTEARAGGEFFGEQRLAELLADCREADAEGIAHRIVDAVLDFQSGFARDDVAVVVLKVPPAS